MNFFVDFIVMVTSVHDLENWLHLIIAMVILFPLLRLYPYVEHSLLSWILPSHNQNQTKPFASHVSSFQPLPLLPHFDLTLKDSEVFLYLQLLMKNSKTAGGVLIMCWNAIWCSLMPVLKLDTYASLNIYQHIYFFWLH